MHCRVCGYRLSRDAVICGECGSVVGSLEPEIFPDSFSQSFPVNYATGSLTGGVEDTRLLQPFAAEGDASNPQRGKHSDSGDVPAAAAGSEIDAAEPIPVSATRGPAVVVPATAASVVSAVPAPVAPSSSDPVMPASADPLTAHPTSVPRFAPASGGEVQPRSTPRHVLTSLTGERLVITGHSVLGRRPQSDDPEMHLLTLVDRTRSVSKTHLELGVVDGMLWVCDLSSANGTIVVMPDGSRVDTAPGQHYSVPPGAHLLLGLAELVVD